MEKNILYYGSFELDEFFNDYEISQIKWHPIWPIIAINLFN